jgi:hypothetical protein
MSTLRWPASTSTESSAALRLALAGSPPPQPPEANYRCRVEQADEQDREIEPPLAAA